MLLHQYSTRLHAAFGSALAAVGKQSRLAHITPGSKSRLATRPVSRFGPCWLSSASASGNKQTNIPRLDTTTVPSAVTLHTESGKAARQDSSGNVPLWTGLERV